MRTDKKISQVSLGQLYSLSLKNVLTNWKKIKGHCSNYGKAEPIKY